MRACARVHVRACACARTRARVRACAYARACARARTHVRACARERACARACVSDLVGRVDEAARQRVAPDAGVVGVHAESSDDSERLQQELARHRVDDGPTER